MTATSTIEAYYDALRCGEPLTPFFLEAPSTVHIDVGETLVGYANVADTLATQTDRTSEWTLDTAGPSVTERDSFAWFHDEVTLGWVDERTHTDHQYETRWTGTLEYRDRNNGWRFVSLHVSVPVESKPASSDLFGDLGDD
ncbi:MAG: nuclear transport factor 2 family protein [Halobacteriota archaeon]